MTGTDRSNMALQAIASILQDHVNYQTNTLKLAAIWYQCDQAVEIDTSTYGMVSVQPRPDPLKTQKP